MRISSRGWLKSSRNTPNDARSASGCRVSAIAYLRRMYGPTLAHLVAAPTGMPRIAATSGAMSSAAASQVTSAISAASAPAFEPD